MGSPLSIWEKKNRRRSTPLICTVNAQAIELNNGRAAQMGILGLMMHEAVDNHPYIINDLVRHGWADRMKATPRQIDDPWHPPMFFLLSWAVL